MSDVVIDGTAFHKRIRVLQRGIEENDPMLDGAKSILVVIGKSNEENAYMKSAVLHNWILGYEFPSTAMVISRNKVIFVTGQSQSKYIDKIKGDNVEIWSRSKDDEHNKKLFQDLVAYMSEQGKVVGNIPKDQFQGPFITKWNEVFDPSKFSMVDVWPFIAKQMEIKDEDELKSIRQASKASQIVIRQFADEMGKAVDEEAKITHEQLSRKIEDKIEDTKIFRDLNDFDAGNLFWCYSPIIQSGGVYDLKASAMSDNKQLTPGVILCSLGLKYKGYCSNVSRTYFINPTPDQKANYDLLLKTHQKVLQALRDGVSCKDLYTIAYDYVKKQSPGTEQKLTKNVGWGIGIDFRDSNVLLNAKNTKEIRNGMTLNVCVGFSNLKDSKNNTTYALMVADTVRVKNDGYVMYTDLDKAMNSVSFMIEDEPATTKVKKGSAGRSTPSAAASRSKLRENTTKAADELETKRRDEKQKILREELQQRGEKQFADEKGSLKPEEKVERKKFESYKRDTQIPKQVQDLKIAVDYQAQTIILPIGGRPVPFHIATYKNGSRTEEGGYVYIRLNFFSPGQGAVKKDEMPFEDPNAEFIKSITLRSKDTTRLTETFKKIQDLKKESVKREVEKREMADVVQQDQLIESRNRRPLRLDMVQIRPGPEGKRVPGTLEIHENGLKYQSPLQADQKVNVLFSNIQHMFFQPCKHELIVLIHFHLKNPIMIGKKKTQDVQFYREAADMAFDETGNRRRKYRYGDEDELEQEQEERKRRLALDREFRNFAEQIMDASNRQVELDIPVRQSGFQGVPFRSLVLCQPTTQCLVQLVDPPFLVVTISDIEVACLERVQFGLKQFDLVLVYKDYTRPVTHINSIPVTEIDDVRDWLTEMAVPFYEGQLNLNWPQIMKTIIADPHQFYQEGGWNIMFADDEAEEGSEEIEEESEFEVSDDSPEDEEESVYSDEGSEQFSEEDDEEASDVSADESDYE